MWVDQWPLKSEKLEAAIQLVQEQLEAGHIEPSNSPWNSPIFVIKKKSGKWWLLQDLRKVNETMYTMGALQPGLPTPMAIPQDTHKIIVDLKDCFYTIPLHPKDKERFTFSIPAINLREPMKQYQWKVLPQGMANSPTLCQKYVTQAIQPVRKKFRTIYIIHYMDDILLAHASHYYLTQAFGELKESLTKFGLCIAPEKVQSHAPYNYLGYLLAPKQFSSQKIQIRTQHLTTLNDFQKLLGDINWIRPSLNITTKQLLPLFNILQGDSDPTSPRTLTKEGKDALKLVESALSSATLQYCDYSQPWDLIILATHHTPTGTLYQQGVLYWIHGNVTPSRTLVPYYELVAERIQQGRKASILYLGMEPSSIVLPYTAQQLEWLLNMCDTFALSLAHFPGTIKHHLPNDKILQFLKVTPFIIPHAVSPKPLPDAVTVFTDGSSNGKAVLITPHKCSTMADFLYVGSTD